MVFINEEVFKEITDGSFGSYNDFLSYLKENNLNIDNFYADTNNMINRVWYIEEFITYPMVSISKKFFEMFDIPNLIKHRRKCIENLLEKKNFNAIFTMVEKPFRISYFLDLYDYLTDEEFINVFSFVYSTCEYGFIDLLNDDVIERLKECKDTENLINNIKDKYEIKDDMVVIYRGEADKSTPFNDGAMSWTLDYKVAKFFANRFNAEELKIYKAKANVNDILIFLDREDEVLIEYENLVDVELLD